MKFMTKNLNEIKNFVVSVKKEIKDDHKIEYIKNLYLKQRDIFKKECENKLDELKNENISLKSRLQNLEKKIEDVESKNRGSIHLESKINELLPLITKLNKISDVAKEMMSKMFIILVEEQLQTIIKLADSHAQKNAYSQIEKDSLIDSIENLIHSDKLLKKAIKIAYESENKKKNNVKYKMG